jgi:hypothetical protein
MPEAVRLARIAEKRLRRLGKAGKATRLVLSLFFKAILGIPRVFHFETLEDVGFAILTGGKTVLSRNTLGGLIRAAPVRGVLRFVHDTEPKIRKAVRHWISIDEHAIARFTRKFGIRKGFHTIRNKRMKIEKLFCSFDIGTRRLLSIIVTRGHERLAPLSKRLLERLRRRARGAEVRVVLDAGAAENYAELLELATRVNQTTLVRVRRHPAYRKAWKALPKTSWIDLEEPGPYAGGRPKLISIAETRMTISGGTRSAVSVRTIVIRERARRGKDRWHALWVFGDDKTTPYDLVREFRERQHHEQTYRVMLHDAYVDTAPSGYNKKSSNPRRPGFRQNALTIYAWVAALATNALDAFTKTLPGGLLPRRFKLEHAHPRTLRRWLLNTPAEIYQTSEALIVLLAPRRLRPLWEHLAERTNAAPIRIPWMGNRRLIISLAKPRRAAIGRAEAALDPALGAGGVWC